jgi:hypothetical protein
VEPAALIESLLDERDFHVPPPGRVRIDRADVWLDRPDYPSDRPIISLRASGRLEVHRAIPMRGGDWLEEFIGSAASDQTDALRRAIGFALTGTSRLAIASHETPHPAFALGMIAYLPPGCDEVVELEARLRSGSPVTIDAGRLPTLIRELFNRLALSPWTPLLDRLIALVLTLDRRTALNSLGYMLRHLSRHLNAFDLVRFHNLGANYPDALMLDALLRAFVPLLEDDATRMDRRALRQGWLARRRCEGLAVPDHPTSPGDNARELPAYAFLPSTQITDPATRTKRLFVDAPADAILTPVARRLLARSANDLNDPEELRELGTATFLDRPLGIAKREGEPDRTPLLSYEAVSVRMIKSRLDELRDAGMIDATFDPKPARGFAVARLPGHARQGVVSLEDAKKVALDFVFTRTTRSSLDALLRQYDTCALNAPAPPPYHLFIRTGRTKLTAFDAGGGVIFELERSDRPSVIECGGVEYAEDLCAVVVDRRVHLPPRPGCC